MLMLARPSRSETTFVPGVLAAVADGDARGSVPIGQAREAMAAQDVADRRARDLQDGGQPLRPDSMATATASGWATTGAPSGCGAGAERTNPPASRCRRGAVAVGRRGRTLPARPCRRIWADSPSPVHAPHRSSPIQTRWARGGPDRRSGQPGPWRGWTGHPQRSQLIAEGAPHEVFSMRLAGGRSPMARRAASLLRDIHQ
jgi:hypothetical protein